MDTPSRPSKSTFDLAKEWDQRHTSPDWLGPREPRAECARCGNPLLVTIDRRFCSFACAGEPYERVQALWRARNEIDVWESRVNCDHCRTSKGAPKRLHFSRKSAQREANAMRAAHPEENQHAHEYPCPVTEGAWHVTTRDH